MKISVKIKPGSSKPGVSVDEGNGYVVKTSARPVGGNANLEMIEILAKHFKVPKRSVGIVAGHKSRNKIVEINDK